ncbi:hypothetical protein NKH18_27085 [Streptomyces sp. M10(2022)]
MTGAAPVVCPNCRTENAPERTLCIRCALLLDPGPPPASARRGGAGSSGAAAGSPCRRDAATAGMAQAEARVADRTASGGGRDLVRASPSVGPVRFCQGGDGAPEAVPPSAFRSSSAVSGHPAGAAFDGFNNRYWAPEEAGEGAGSSWSAISRSRCG